MAFPFRRPRRAHDGHDSFTCSHRIDGCGATHGVVALSQLAELEMSRSQLRTASIKRHLLVEAAPRVYAVVGSPDTLEQRQQVALLCLGSDAVLSHEAAARLHRFDRCRPDVIELTVLRRHHGVRAPFRIHTTNSLPAIDRVMVDAWPVTSASRTVISPRSQSCQ